MAFVTPFLFGTAATAATATTAATAATAGLLGTGGAFSLGTALTSLGTAMGAFGALSGAAAQANAAEYNASIAASNAAAARAQGVAAMEAQQRESVRRMGAMTAAYGASGVSSEAGSPLDVLQDSARQAAYDKLAIKYKYDSAATGYANQATLAESNASSARTSGLLKAGGYVMSAAGKYYTPSGSGSSISDLYGDAPMAGTWEGA